MYDRLLESLRGAGQPAEPVEMPDGTRILVLPHGGRILGLFAPGSGENFLWTNPALESVAGARAFFSSADWHNSGGDRTWLAPEVDLFFPDFPKLDRYVQPRSLDPGDHRFILGKEGPFLSNILSVVLSRTREKLDLEIRKSLGPALNPLRHERDLLPGGLEYAGYTLRTSLEIRGDVEPRGRIGLWNLLQMPHGGDLLIPTFARSQPKVYFGEAAAGFLVVADRLVLWRMRAAGEHKIGIRAAAATGRAGYLYPSESGWALVVRSFDVDPSGEYIDVPWTDPEDLGYAVQACSVSSGLGRFSELEYHVPAIGEGTGRRRCEDTSRVWAFRGSEEALREVAGALLGGIG